MNQKQDKHIVDVLFVIGLFCIFALSSFFLISIGANIYRKTVAHMDENFNTRTSLSYVVEKIRQAVRSVVQLAEVQQQYKQSSNRANGVARELRELEKVLARSENRPDYRQTANSLRTVINK